MIGQIKRSLFRAMSHLLALRLLKPSSIFFWSPGKKSINADDCGPSPVLRWSRSNQVLGNPLKLQQQDEIHLHHGYPSDFWGFERLPNIAPHLKLVGKYPSSLKNQPIAPQVTQPRSLFLMSQDAPQVQAGPTQLQGPFSGSLRFLHKKTWHQFLDNMDIKMFSNPEAAWKKM